MAMTKKEKAAFDEAIYKAELLSALRWTCSVEKDVPPPGQGHTELYSSGWDYNAYSNKVYEAWSDSVSHGLGEPPLDRRYASASQKSIWLYSTKELALKAMRRCVEIESAKKLLLIDKMIKGD